MGIAAALGPILGPAFLGASFIHDTLTTSNQTKVSETQRQELVKARKTQNVLTPLRKLFFPEKNIPISI